MRGCVRGACSPGAVGGNAEELRDAIGSLPLLPDRSVTVSVSEAEQRAGEDCADWMKRGDENLYRAKSAGRDRVAA
jgi:GGDEF domain-containing protein